MNTVVLVGNLTKDVELRYTKTGKTVCNFDVATNEKVGDEERTSFVRVQTWDNVAQGCATLKKGERVIIVGRWSTRSYEQNGEKRYTTECVAYEVGASVRAKTLAEFVEDLNSGKKEEIPF